MLTTIKVWLTHPATRGLDIDDPRTTELRRSIIQEKTFLRKIYQEWYEQISKALPEGEEPILEVGSGAGFLNDYIPALISSDVLKCAGLSLVLDACQGLPFQEGSLRGIVFVNVFHHLPRPRLFLSEAIRCIRPGGMVVMIEPWLTPWSRLIYRYLHHEPIDPQATHWEIPASGPLSGANSAMPWIIFERDRRRFESLFPCLKIEGIKLLMPFRYLISGGVSLRSLMPGWTFGLFRLLEKIFQPWMKTWSMFALISLRKLT